MNLTATHLSLASLGLVRPTPGCAVITPTRSTGLGSQLWRLIDRLSDAWHTRALARQAAKEAMRVDSATMRDLGVSHAATLRERVDPLAERRHPHFWS